MSQDLEGVCELTNWDETPYGENEDGSKLSHAIMKQSYTGNIEGAGEVHYLMSYQASGSVVFVGYETVTGDVAGRSGSFVLQHDGTFENGVAKSTFHVVAGSGRGDFCGMTGHGSFASEHGGKSGYKLAVEF